MIRVLIATHGKLSEGFVSAIKLIIGDQANVDLICAYVDDNNIEVTIDEYIAANRENKLIILTDLLGGSVNNYFLKYCTNENIYLIAGINLAIILEIVCSIQTCQNIENLIVNSIDKARNSIVYCNSDYLLNVGETQEF